MVWWRGCWGGGRAAVRKGLGLLECGGWASNGIQIELRAPLRFCMVKSELHFNFDWAPFGIDKWDPTWFFFFAMKTSLHDLILFFCNGDFIARPDSFFVMVLPFGSHWKKNQALKHKCDGVTVAEMKSQGKDVSLPRPQPCRESSSTSRWDLACVRNPDYRTIGQAPAQAAQPPPSTQPGQASQDILELIRAEIGGKTKRVS